MRTLITGATGMIGSRLLPHLGERVVLTRRVDRYTGPPAEVHAWDALDGPPPRSAFDGVRAIVHLAGSPLADGRWNDEKKRRIHDSRVLGTRNLVEGLLQSRAAGGLPEGSHTAGGVLVCSSAVGIYGDRGDEILDETSVPGRDFLSETCAAWEAEARRAEQAGWRVVTVRTGIALGRTGGALERMVLPFRWALGARLGSGNQWWSWIHEEDLTRVFLYCLREDLRGPVNAVAPNPVTNKDFTAALAKAVGRPARLAAPGWALRLLLGEFASFLLSSQRVVPEVLSKQGFAFEYPRLPGALGALLGPPSPSDSSMPR